LLLSLGLYFWLRSKIGRIRDKWFKAFFTLYLLLLVADIASTLATGQLAAVLETNPLYSWRGFVPIILLNLAVTALFWWAYTKRGTILRYAVLLEMSVIMGVRIIAVRNALYWIKHPISLEAARAIATPAVKAANTQYIETLVVFAIITGFVAFLVYYLDHHLIRRK
jgi:hypothetical protein